MTSAAWGVERGRVDLSLNELRTTTEFLARYSDRVVGPEGLPGLQDRLVAIGVNPAERELGQQEFDETLGRAAAGDPRWRHSPSIWWGNILALVGIGAACLAGAAFALRRRDVKLLGVEPPKAAGRRRLDPSDDRADLGQQVGEGANELAIDVPNRLG